MNRSIPKTLLKFGRFDFRNVVNKPINFLRFELVTNSSY